MAGIPHFGRATQGAKIATESIAIVWRQTNCKPEADYAAAWQVSSPLDQFGSCAIGQLHRVLRR